MARTLAQLDAAVAALEARFAPVADPPPHVETATATITDGDKVITSTSGTKADLEALIAAKNGKE